jgi:hypothetical protein
MKRTLLILCALVATVVARAQYGPYPILPIDTVQFVNSSKLTRVPPVDSPDYVNPVKKNATFGDTVRVVGIVMMDPRAYGLSTARKGTFIQRDSTNGGPWAGVLILADPGAISASATTSNNTIGGFLNETKFYDNLKVGYKVRVTGVIRQFNISGTSTGETQIDMLHDYNPNFTNSVEVLSITPKTIPPVTMTVDSFMTGNPGASNVTVNRVTGEKYAGVYVELRNVTVYTRTVSGSRWVWSVIDDNGNAMQIRDFSGYYRNDALEDTSLHIPHTFAPPPIGARLSYIRGVITEASANSVSGYWIAPLSPSDLGTITYSNPSLGSITRNPVIAGPSDSVQFTVKTVNGSGKVTKVRLYYTVGYNNFVFDSITLTSPDSISWYGKVPNKPLGSVVKYWVKIIDQNGYFRNNPDSLGTNSAYVVSGGVNTIADIQYSPFPNGATVWNNDSLTGINVKGIVTGINYLSGSGATAQNLITIQNGTGPNSAIFIQRAATNDVTASWAIGDSVNITAAKVLETFSISTLNNISATKLASGRTLPPFAANLRIDSFSTPNHIPYARPYEGVLMRFDSVVIYNPNPDGPSSNFYEFSFAKDTLAPIGLRVDDMNASIHNVSSKVKKGMLMGYIQGPMFFSFSNFKLIPRGLSDIDLSHLDSIAPVVTLKGRQYDTISINHSYHDSGAVAIDNIDGNITTRIIRTGSVDSAIAGNYTLTYSATDNWGNTGSVNRYVNVRLNTSVKEAEMAQASVKVYPSPAQNELIVSASGIQTLPVSLTIFDMIGREVMSRQVKQGSFTEKIDISTLPNGVYFCTIANDKGSRTIKFMVSGK